MDINIFRIKISHGKISLNLQRMDQQSIPKILRILKLLKEMLGRLERLLRTERIGRLKHMMKLLALQGEKKHNIFELRIVPIQYMVIQFQSLNI